jgi:hypothetical protein
MIRRIARATVLAFGLAAICCGTALAAKGGAGTETFTEHGHEVPFFEFPVTNPCNGQEGLLSAVAKNFVFHATTQPDGNAWITGTGNGTASFVPFEEGPTFSGHFTAWFGEALNEKNHVEHSTTTIVLTSAEGAHVTIHMKGHLSTNANGEVTAEFEHEGVHTLCG